MRLVLILSILLTVISAQGKEIQLLDSLITEIDKFRDEYLPHIEHEKSIIPLYRFIDIEDGQEYKMMADGRPHPVLYDNGQAWIVYGSRRVDI